MRSRSVHLRTCGYILVRCTNDCKVYSRKRRFSIEPQPPKQITLKVYRKDLEKHLAECPRRLYSCPYCEEIGEYQNIAGFHTFLCSKMTIKCSNAPLCKQTFLRESKEVHLLSCLYQKVLCKYNEVGCTVQPLRKDLEDHENDDKAHLRITMETVLKMKAQCASLTRESYKLKTPSTSQHSLLKTELPTVPFVFRIDNYKQQKEQSELFHKVHSPPFLTHRRGYKLMLKVDLNGNLGIEIDCFLMKGEYDGQLEFPFKGGKITVELLNQLEDSNHHSQAATTSYHWGKERVLDSDTPYFPLVTFTNFFLFKNLSFTANKNCQYLKDDCLVFRVHVEVPSYKPWLQCT